MINEEQRLYLTGLLLAIQGVYILTHTIPPTELTFTIIALVTGLITPVGRIVKVIGGNND